MRFMKQTACTVTLAVLATPGARPSKDTDGDGIPDEGETANPRDPKDDAALRPSGYSNIEEYLNDLARKK